VLNTLLFVIVTEVITN